MVYRIMFTRVISYDVVVLDMEDTVIKMDVFVCDCVLFGDEGSLLQRTGILP